MSISFRPVEEVALRHVRADQLAKTNWPAWQTWRNLVKAEINKEIKLAEQRVEWHNRYDAIHGITKK